MRLLNRQSGIVQSVSYASANVAGSVLSAISLIILSRALGPTNFGAFSVAFSLTQMTARIADLGLSVALQRFIAKNYQHDADAVAAAIHWSGRIKLILAFLSILIGILFGPLIGTRIFGLTDERFATIGIALASIIILYEYLVLLNQSVHQFKIASLLNALQAGLKFIFGFVVLLIVVPSAYYSYIWYSLFPLLAVIYGFYSLPQKFRRPLAIPTTIKQELIKTAKFSYISALAITVADQLDVLMVKSMMDEYSTGLFSSASRISLIFVMFAASVGSVLNTRVAKYIKRRDLKSFYKKSYVVAIALVLSAPILMLLAKPLLLISAGPAYLAALPTVRLMLLSTTFAMATIPLIAVFYSLDYPRYFMISGLIAIVTLIAGNYLLIPDFGIEGSAWAKIIMRTIVLLYTAITSYVVIKKTYET